MQNELNAFYLLIGIYIYILFFFTFHYTHKSTHTFVCGTFVGVHRKSHTQLGISAGGQSRRNTSYVIRFRDR